MADAEGASAPVAPRESQALLRLLVESVHEYAIFALDATGHVASWNPGAERLKGYRADEILGQHFSRFYPPEVPRAKVDAELDTAVREGQFREEGWRVRKDGSRFWADVTITPMRAADGALVGFAKVTRDLSARRQAEEQRLQLAQEQAARVEAERVTRQLQEVTAEARRAHEQLRLVFEGIAEGIIVQSRDGRIVLANDTGARMCGFDTAAEMVAAPISEILARFELFDEGGRPFPLDDLPARRVLRGEDHAEAVLRSRPQGSQADRWSLSRATALRDEAGEIAYAVSIFEDIGERRRLIERLRFLNDAGELLGSSLEYEKALAAVAELAVPRIADWCMVDVLDASGGVRRLAVAHRDPSRLEWAREMGERYPVRLEEAMGAGAVLRTGEPEIVAEVTEDLIRSTVKDEERLAVVLGVGVRSYICVPLTARGRNIGALTLLTTAESDRRYDDQDLTMAVLLGRRAGLSVDNARLYTETEAALGQVTEISRMKDEFLATLSHELRTPLNAIVGWSQMLMTGTLDAALTRKGVETIDRNASLQARLIADILDMSRIITGKVRLAMSTVDPAVVVEQALDTVRPAADAKGIRIESILDPGAGPISADPERLQQVLWNLLSNAVKFTPRGGRVQVRLEAVSSHVELVVADTGPGIDPAFLPHVFERFRQADSSSTRVHGGLGLGLAIVRHLVELHGGQVRAGNREGGQGAVFVVELPRRASALETSFPALVLEGQAVAGAEASGMEQTLAGVNVMVVDDEDDAREVLAVALSRRGAEVLKLASAEAALEAIGRARPDVLLADIEMPGTDGYQLMQAVRKLAPERGGLTPAIAITAYAGIEDRVRALAGGFDLHLPKPIKLDELHAAVARLAGRRR